MNIGRNYQRLKMQIWMVQGAGIWEFGLGLFQQESCIILTFVLEYCFCWRELGWVPFQMQSHRLNCVLIWSSELHLCFMNKVQISFAFKIKIDPGQGWFQAWSHCSCHQFLEMWICWTLEKKAPQRTMDPFPSLSSPATPLNNVESERSHAKPSLTEEKMVTT